MLQLALRLLVYTQASCLHCPRESRPLVDAHVVHWSVTGLHSRQYSPPLHCTWYVRATDVDYELCKDQLLLLELASLHLGGQPAVLTFLHAPLLRT